MSEREALRILFLIDNLRPGGAQKALLAILRALRAMRAESAVWRLGGTSEIEEEFGALRVPVLGGSEAAWKALAQPLSLFRYLRRERVTLVQTFLFHADVTGRLVARFARLLRRGTGVPIIVSSVRASNVRNRWWQFGLERLTAPLADAFTAVSSRTLDFAVAREGVAPGRAAVIPNGIELADWQAMPDGESARVELGVAPDAFAVGTIGRLHEQKGHAFLLAAARRVLAERPDAVFLIAGYGPLRDRLEAQARELGIASSVKFLGYRKDVQMILAALDLFVLPSLWEGMSNAILEAMAARKPVIATSVDGNVEQVLDGETGLLVPPGDADALADALLGLAGNRDKAREMGRRGRERVASDFPMSRMTTAYLDLYARLLEEKAGVKPETWRP